MNKLKIYVNVLLLLLVVLFSYIDCVAQEKWLKATQQSKPWTRWWWMGSCVDKENLTKAMELYKQAGLGGLEITPIYGVKGYENRFIEYLSPEWVELLNYVLEEGKRLDIGIDMATGTGWPFGGPWIEAEHACKNMVVQTYSVKKGKSLSNKVELMQKTMATAVNHRIDIADLVEPISKNKDLQSLALAQVRFKKPLNLQILMAYSDNGDIIDLTDKIDKKNRLKWTAPDCDWTLYAVFQGWHGKIVERAAPGGEGDVIDHFSGIALQAYLEKFNNALDDDKIQSVRAFFNDSYEVDDASGEANFTPDLFEEFKIRKGYDLTHHLPTFFSEDTTEQRKRLLCDYREVISDLLLEGFTLPWREWAKSKQAIVRNQAHGSPANILDLYGASDIPETEGTDIIQFKFASSAANVLGKQLISAEAATWLNEHFLASLAEVKHALDKYFLGGVNHIVYHGTPYSPNDEFYPGWLFYAAVHFGPTNSFWNDFPKLNQYVMRCQTFLQAGKPANDVLVYFPIYDKWSEPGRSLLQHFKGTVEGSAVREIAEKLLEHGFSFDFISDRQLYDLRYNVSGIQSSGGSYQTIIIPNCQFIPLKTFNKLIDIASAGGKIIFHQQLPSDVPGMAELETKQAAYRKLTDLLEFKKIGNENISRSPVDKGLFLIGDDIPQLLEIVDVKNKSMIESDLHSIKRKTKDGLIYFIVNKSESSYDGWITLQTQTSSAVIFNPMSGIYGLAEMKQLDNSSTGIYLQLNKGESCILRTFNKKINIAEYPYLEREQEILEISGQWDLQFITGGPVLPEKTNTPKLGSWTELEGEDFKAFAGTGEYSIQFEKPNINADFWMLDLGDVHESAVIILNDVVLDTLITAPYQVHFSNQLLRDQNNLKVRVSNLMANRIAFLDRNNIVWKKFYNINFPAKNRENRDDNGLFNASTWLPLKSGLIGPVKIIPLARKIM
ncbi:glycoside hydrolase family 2 protein [candidate division KSB1 bacterium]|nr:glycoside hydrolase family 2 protein [candidate division KSB1 bacterium]